MFCDDVRQEVFGKLSLMGIYGGELNVFSRLPTVLPKLCIMAQVSFPADQPITNAKLQIYLPQDEDNPSVLIDLTDWAFDPNLENLDDPPPPLDLEPVNIRTSFHFITPFLIEKDGWLRVRVVTDQGRLKIGALRITSAPLPQS